MPRILFLCAANAFRSQIAEAWARSLGGMEIEVQSAGLEATRIHPLAVTVMAEVGIDMSGQLAKGMTPEMLADADVVVTLCGALLGWFPATRRNVTLQHWPFPDPAAFTGSEQDLLAGSRRVRDGIRLRVEGLLTSLRPVWKRLRETGGVCGWNASAWHSYAPAILAGARWRKAGPELWPASGGRSTVRASRPMG